MRIENNTWIKRWIGEGGRRTDQGRWCNVGELGLDNIFEIQKKQQDMGEEENNEEWVFV